MMSASGEQCGIVCLLKYSEIDYHVSDFCYMLEAHGRQEAPRVPTSAGSALLRWISLPTHTS